MSGDLLHILQKCSLQNMREQKSPHILMQFSPVITIREKSITCGSLYNVKKCYTLVIFNQIVKIRASVRTLCHSIVSRQICRSCQHCD